MKAGTRKILAKAVRSLEAARELSSDGAIDLAAGRGYYAMLYAAKALIYEKGLRVSAHAAIVDAFERHVVGMGSVSASHLDWIREALRRRTTDREADLALTSSDVEGLVEQAGEIVAEATRLLEKPSAREQ
jgi:uncharacterized protein (UPF0332 family)